MKESNDRFEQVCEITNITQHDEKCAKETSYSSLGHRSRDHENSSDKVRNL